MVLQRPGVFALRVLRGFHRNQGLLLSGAVAYYTLLSIVPLFALFLVVLSHFMDQERLFATMATNLELIVPGYAEQVTEQVRIALQHRQIVGGVGLVVLLFFSSLAFTVLEKTMCVIFFHRAEVRHRHFLVSAAIPYAYILLMGVGVLLVSLISGALQTLDTEQVSLFGHAWSLRGTSRLALYLLGLTGLAMMLTSLYLVMPIGRIAFRHALIGGVTAAVLWELTRHVLVWYFANLSLVNLVYGSLATAVVALLSFEIAAIILLLGAQVISEFERNTSELCEAAGESDGFRT